MHLGKAHQLLPVGGLGVKRISMLGNLYLVEKLMGGTASAVMAIYDTMLPQTIAHAEVEIRWISVVADCMTLNNTWNSR